MPSPTVKEIAALAGVSAMTVSRVLRGAPRNSPATRQRVLKIAREIGYRPNPMVSALMSARSRSREPSAAANLALLKVDAGKEIRGFADGAREQAEKYGYSMEEYILRAPEMPPERLRRILIQRGVRGIILLPVPQAASDLKFDFEGFATAAIGFSVSHPRIPRVTSNAYLRTAEALERLSDAGFTRVGIIYHPDLDLRFNHSIYAAVQVVRAFHSPRLRVETCLLENLREYGAPSREERCRLRRWISRHELQAVISQIECMPQVLVEEGFRIPGDLGYVHLHHHPDPRIACMDQMCRLTGQKAVEMIVTSILNNEYSLPEHPVVLSVPSVWRSGASACQPKAAARRGPRRTRKGG